MRERGWPLALVVALWLVATTASAFAHAERSASTPDEGTRVEAAPSSLKIEFTEPPIADANFEVWDGCGRDVVEGIEVQGTGITASLAEGQPGSWSVRTQVVSGIDGHATKDRWRFLVAGEADCEAEPGPGATSAGGENGKEEAGGSFLLMFAAGTLVVIALALLVRRKSGS